MAQTHLALVPQKNVAEHLNGCNRSIVRSSAFFVLSLIAVLGILVTAGMTADIWIIVGLFFVYRGFGAMIVQGGGLLEGPSMQALVPCTLDSPDERNAATAQAVFDAGAAVGLDIHRVFRFGCDDASRLSMAFGHEFNRVVVVNSDLYANPPLMRKAIAKALAHLRTKPTFVESVSRAARIGARELSCALSYALIMATFTGFATVPLWMILVSVMHSISAVVGNEVLDRREKRMRRHVHNRYLRVVSGAIGEASLKPSKYRKTSS